MQDARSVGLEPGAQLNVQFRDARPVALRVPVVLLVIAVVEPEKVVKAVVLTNGVGELIAGLGAIVFEIAFRVTKHPAEIVGRQVEHH